MSVEEAKEEYDSAYPTVTRRLLESGADAGIRSCQNETPFELALKCEQWGVAATLAAYDPQARAIDRSGKRLNGMRDKFGRSVLHHAAMRHATFWARRLVTEWGADIAAVDGTGCSVLFVASGNGDAEMIEALLGQAATESSDSKSSAASV